MIVTIGGGGAVPDVNDFGNASLAQKVIGAVASGMGKEQVLPYRCVTTLTWDECARLGLRPWQCHALQTVFMTSIFRPMAGAYGMVITPEEREELEKSGFSREFIGALAGPDGTEALKARIQWLQSAVVKYGGPENYSASERRFMLEELGEIGPDAASAITTIMAMGASGLAPEMMDPVSAMEQNVLARLSYAGKICSGTQWGLEGLIIAVQSSDPSRQACALKALRKMGRIAQPALPALMKEYRRALKETNWKERCTEILETIDRVAEPTEEKVEFFEEVLWGKYGLMDLAAEKLKGVFKTTGQKVRMKVLDILMALSRWKQVGIYFDALTSPKRKKRWDAANLMYYHDSQNENAPYFFAALRHRSKTIRRRALSAITGAALKTNSTDDILLLIDWLSHRDPKIRRQAAEALGNQGEKAKYALPILAAIKSDPRQATDLRATAGEAMEKIEEEVL